MTIKGTEGMSPGQFAAELDRGGRIVQFGYCISVLILTFRQTATVFSP